MPAESAFEEIIWKLVEISRLLTAVQYGFGFGIDSTQALDLPSDETEYGIQ